MDRKLCSVLLVLFLSLGVTSLAQGRGQGHGPAGGLPPAVSTQHGGGDHGDHGQANKPSETNQSTNSPSNDVSTHLTRNSALAARLQTMIGGGDLQTAADGYRNWGQFVAACHASKRLNIPFDQLKADMVGKHLSLADSIHDLKPNLTTEQAKTEAKKAEDEAKDDIKTTS